MILDDLYVVVNSLLEKTSDIDEILKSEAIKKFNSDEIVEKTDKEESEPKQKNYLILYKK